MILRRHLPLGACQSQDGVTSKEVTMFRLERLPPVIGAFAFVTLLVILPMVGLLLWVVVASFIKSL